MTDKPRMPIRTLTVGRRPGLFLLVGLCSIGFFVADVATATCLREPIPGMLVLGIVTAQLTVICVWGTLVRGTFWIRLPWTLLLLVVSWCGLAWGITLEKGNTNPDALLGTAVTWMFGFITSFVPLKIAALCFRWQIIHDTDASPNAGRNFNYAIRDIMIGTLLLAMTMGIGRGMLTGEDINFTRALYASGLHEPELLFVISLYGVVSLLVKLPCIWISLGEKAEKIPSRIVVWVVYCFLLTIFEIGMLVTVLGNPGSDSGVIFTGMILSHQLMGAIMLAVCCTLRGLGYRLERSRSPQTDLQTELRSDSTAVAAHPESV
ncbi:hypothetical protein [Novipirellula caenicola]